MKKNKKKVNSDSQDESIKKRAKWINEKVKKEITVFVSRKNNQALPDEILNNMSPTEKFFWNEQILTKENVSRYSELLKKDKGNFIHHLVATKIGNHVNVNKINDETEEVHSMTVDEIVEYLKGKFSYKQKTYKQKQKKKQIKR